MPHTLLIFHAKGEGQLLRMEQNNWLINDCLAEPSELWTPIVAVLRDTQSDPNLFGLNYESQWTALLWKPPNWLLSSRLHPSTRIQGGSCQICTCNSFLTFVCAPAPTCTLLCTQTLCVIHWVPQKTSNGHQLYLSWHLNRHPHNSTVMATLTQLPGLSVGVALRPRRSSFTAGNPLFCGSSPPQFPSMNSACCHSKERKVPCKV